MIKNYFLDHFFFKKSIKLKEKDIFVSQLFIFNYFFVKKTFYVRIDQNIHDFV